MHRGYWTVLLISALVETEDIADLFQFICILKREKVKNIIRHPAGQIIEQASERMNGFILTYNQEQRRSPSGNGIVEL